VRGALRDQLACVKTVLDLLERRRPVLGPPDPAVLQAIDKHREAL
jgi:hypothetical protein